MWLIILPSIKQFPAEDQFSIFPFFSLKQSSLLQFVMMSLDTRLKVEKLHIGVICEWPKTKILWLESSSVNFVISLDHPNSDLHWSCRANPMRNVTVFCFYAWACLPPKMVLLEFSLQCVYTISILSFCISSRDIDWDFILIIISINQRVSALLRKVLGSISGCLIGHL